MFTLKDTAVPEPLQRVYAQYLKKPCCQKSVAIIPCTRVRSFCQDGSIRSGKGRCGECQCMSGRAPVNIALDEARP